MVGNPMNELRTQKNIEQALKDFQCGVLAMNAENLLSTLGYESEITMDFESSLAEEFISYFDEFGKLNPERAMVDDWESIDFLFQLTEKEISGSGQTRIAFNNRQLDNTIIESYVFFALKLRESSYTRTQLSNITREINKLMPMPAMLIFQHGQTLTLAVINRRLHKRDESKDVLEKVTLIKDIHSHDPHPAHIKILFDLSRNELLRVHGFSNFVELHRAWEKTLDIQELNKQFYRELSNWYFWAVDNVTFPEDAGENVDIRNATSIIRLITRLIFVWFIKEKKLVPDTFFNPREIEKILISTDPQESTYYKAILQNLFFATLNQEMNTAEKSDNRKFRGKGRQHYNITSLYRYEAYFANSDAALRHFETIPFLNGGLFECLDKGDKDNPKKILRIDGFSDRADNPLSVPNFLFFSSEREVDLNKVYDTKGKRYKVRGLIEILHRYKFTITENTPIEEEVALDPELLGKVFENLLAAYNPETGATARKQTGSFYTPREIVNYMVDESLIAHLKSELVTYYESESTFAAISPPSQLDLSGRADPVQTGLDTQKTVLSDKQKSDIEKKLRHLIAYKDEPHQFNADETEQLIKAIDTFKILDPACGSGAFPMGILHKLVFILGKLDPRNDQWRQRQIVKVENLINIAEGIDDSTVRENTIRDLETEIDNINEAFERNELDYGRKLYLIENCIYGVDIQPVAVQIAKLRFFISLVVDQRIDDAQENRGVRPLPNLETKFVAGNTLISVEKPAQQTLRNPEIDRKETALSEVRRKHFTARTPRTKEKYRDLDKQIRADISQLLKSGGFPSETTEKIANWDPYNQNTSADFFDPEWMFGITDGFDVVIGNPPYVQLQKNGGVLGRLYQDAGFETFVRSGDVYCLFYERGIQLLTTDGHLCYITSNKWMRAGYGKNLRQFFVQNIRPQKLLDLGPNIFDATVDTNILLCTQKSAKETPSIACTVEEEWKHTTTTLITYVEKNGVDFPLPPSGEPWVIMTFIERQIKAKIEDVGVRLKDWNASFYHGIKTGYNTAFLVDDQIKDSLMLTHSKSAEIIKPILRGKNLKRYRADSSQLWLIDTHNGYQNVAAIDVENYPSVKKHLDGFYDQLKKRQDKGKTPYNLRSCAYYMEFAKEKIVWGNIAYSSTFCYSEPGEFITAPANLLTSQENNIKYLLACMNSKIFNWEFVKLGIPLGYAFEWKKQYVELIHVPPITDENRGIAEQIEGIVAQILTAKKADPDTDTTAFENEIDQLVYTLYDLTPEEIAIVEAATE